MTTTKFNRAKYVGFARQMLGIINQASAALMTSIGNETGLFDTLAGLPPSTSNAIAEAAGLNERYVREWLGAMVTSRIVEYNGADKTFALPPEHAAFLTHAAGSNNMADATSFIPLLATVEDKIVECFRNGGGVPYAAYPRFQQVMAHNSGQVHDASLIDVILPLVPGAIERLQAGIDAADIGCGRGHAVNLMARAFPRSRFTGFDFSAEGIDAGKCEAAQWGLPNAEFELKDVTTFNMPAQFDLITAFDIIHDQAQPAQVLRGIAEALRAGGAFLAVDIAASSDLADNLAHPFGTFGYTVSTMHCMTVSLAYGGLGLGTMWGKQKALQMLGEAGFTIVDVRTIDGDIFNNYYIATRT